jgi:hypothetical protein
MSRPLRIEFPGAVYHVTLRCDRREPIYRDDEDRTTQLEIMARAMDRFDAQVLAYCQMGNHFHLLLHTRRANKCHWGPGQIPMALSPLCSLQNQPEEAERRPRKTGVMSSCLLHSLG